MKVVKWCGYKSGNGIRETGDELWETGDIFNNKVIETGDKIRWQII